VDPTARSRWGLKKRQARHEQQAGGISWLAAATTDHNAAAEIFDPRRPAVIGLILAQPSSITRKR
jgi:hypothetical protein